jgi:aspartyl protease family protein
MAKRKPGRRPNLVFRFLLAGIFVVLIALFVTRDGDTTFGMPSRDFAQLGFLVILLVFVSSALFGRGFRLGEIARSMVVWVAIILLLVGGYAYRDELLGVSGRVLGVLAPGFPIAGRFVDGQDADSVMIVRSSGGHFAIRAAVDDTTLFFLVDTGASFVTLTPEDAAAVGFDVGALDFSLPIRTANGSIQAAPIVIDRLSVGDIEREGVRALVAPQGSLDQSLLGLSFLNTLQSYTIAGDRLLLTP